MCRPSRHAEIPATASRGHSLWKDWRSPADRRSTCGVAERDGRTGNRSGRADQATIRAGALPRSMNSQTWKKKCNYGRDLTILNQRSQDWHVPAGNQTRASTVGGEYIIERALEQLVSYFELSHMSLWWLPPSASCMCYMNIHGHTWTALECRSNSTCKADGLMPSCALRNTSKSPLWRDLSRSSPS